MTDAQINPPFDGSPPCPMCQSEVRGMSALLHNAMNRWGEAKMMVKFHDLLPYAGADFVLTVPHPATERMVELVRDLNAITTNIKVEPNRISWEPSILEGVLALHDRIKAVNAELTPLSNAHFDDSRHCSSETPNYLRSAQGSNESGSYNYTVDVVETGGDLRHTVCGTELKLHEHFLERMGRDPAFYALVYCPTCRQNLPAVQFENRVIQ